VEWSRKRQRGRAWVSGGGARAGLLGNAMVRVPSNFFPCFVTEANDAHGPAHGILRP
jgi:hypothetical protein